MRWAWSIPGDFDTPEFGSHVDAIEPRPHPYWMDVVRGERGHVWTPARSTGWAAAVAIALVALSGCGNEAGAPSAAAGGSSAEAPSGRAPDTTASAPGATAPSVDSTDWTAGRLSAPAASGARPPVPVLTGLRTGAHPEYERVVIDVDGGAPGYRLEYVDRPLHECGSGREVFPVGDAWLELRLEPAAAHTEEGRPTLGEREIAVDGELVRRIYRTCDFEGVVTLVVAVTTPNPFRVVRLSDPTRLAVDVRR